MAPRHSGPARLAAAANIAPESETSLFRGLKKTAISVISSFHRIVWRICRISHVVCRISYGYIRSIKHRMA